MGGQTLVIKILGGIARGIHSRKGSNTSQNTTNTASSGKYSAIRMPHEPDLAGLAPKWLVAEFGISP